MRQINRLKHKPTGRFPTESASPTRPTRPIGNRRPMSAHTKSGGKANKKKSRQHDKCVLL